MANEQLKRSEQIRIAALQEANKTAEFLIGSRYRIDNSISSITELARDYEKYISTGKIKSENKK